MYVAPLKRLKTLPVLTAGARLEPFEGTADDGATGLDASTLVDLGPTRLRVGDQGPHFTTSRALSSSV